MRNLVVLMLALLAGCASLGDARQGKGSGVSRVYDASFEQVWRAAPAAIKEAGLELVADNQMEGYILAERGVSGFSWGEKVAVFLERAPSGTRVEVVSKRALATNILASDFGPIVLDNIDKALRQR